MKLAAYAYRIAALRTSLGKHTTFL
jgi:hypothetical protein